jgi:hypothetical protein
MGRLDDGDPGKARMKEGVERYRSIPVEYKQKPENKADDLFKQMRILSQVSYKDVDCFYKYSIFATWGGTK